MKVRVTQECCCKGMVGELIEGSFVAFEKGKTCPKGHGGIWLNYPSEWHYEVVKEYSQEELERIHLEDDEDEQP